MLDGGLTVPAEDWKLVDGCANTYVAPFRVQGQLAPKQSKWYLPTTP